MAAISSVARRDISLNWWRGRAKDNGGGKDGGTGTGSDSVNNKPAGILADPRNGFMLTAAKLSSSRLLLLFAPLLFDWWRSPDRELCERARAETEEPRLAAAPKLPLLTFLMGQGVLSSISVTSGDVRPSCAARVSAAVTTPALRVWRDRPRLAVCWLLSPALPLLVALWNDRPPALLEETDDKLASDILVDGGSGVLLTSEGATEDRTLRVLEAALVI